MMDNFEGRNPEVSESADNAAEQKAINAQEIHDFKETLISSVSSGVLDSVVGRPDEFESQLRRTLDELIMTYFRNHVNTAEISDEKIQTLSADLQKIMTDFVKSVQGGVGMALDASDVRDVYDIDSQLDQSKLQFAKYFEKRYLRRFVEREYSDELVECDLKVGYESGVLQLDAGYESSVRDDVSIGFGNLDDVAGSQSRSGDLASRIGRQMGEYDLGNVNNHVDDFNLLDRTIGLSDEQLSSMSLSDSVDFVYQLLLKSLAIDPILVEKRGSLQVDSIPVDKLLVSGRPVLCRHIVVMFKVIMDRLKERQVALVGENASLKGVEFMPLQNYDIMHATLAVVKGGMVTVLEPSFSLSLKKKSIMDATFSSTHGTSVTHFLKQLTMASVGNESVLSPSVMQSFNLFASGLVRDPAARKSEVYGVVMKAWPHLVVSQGLDICRDVYDGVFKVSEVETLIVNLYACSWDFLQNGIDDISLSLVQKIVDLGSVLREQMKKMGEDDLVKQIDSLVTFPLAGLITEYVDNKDSREFDPIKAFDTKLFEQNFHALLDNPDDEVLQNIVARQFKLGLRLGIKRMNYLNSSMKRIGFNPKFLDTGLRLTSVILKAAGDLNFTDPSLKSECEQLRVLFNEVLVVSERNLGIKPDKYTG